MRSDLAALALVLQQLQRNDARHDLDLLFGCLIDWGLPLSLPYSSEQIDGCTVHTYNGGDLIACFDANIPESVVKEIAQRKPLRAVFRDSGFASSPEKINVFEIFKLYMPEDAGEKIYKCRVYNGYGRPRPETELRYGPNIKDWPTMYPMQENMLLELAAVIHDPVTTTDELIPSGETSLTATVNDIAENPHNLQFIELEAAQVARVVNEVEFVVLNGNYALEAGYSVGKDAIAYEANDSIAAKTYVNIIAVKEGNENSDKIKALVSVLRSDEIKKFIDDTYDGAVIFYEK